MSEIILIFNGAEMQLKKNTNQKRRNQREKSLELLKKYIQEDNIEMA